MNEHLAEFDALIDEDQQIKHCYALFGVAVYSAQCLEAELLNLLVALRVSRRIKLEEHTVDSLQDFYSRKTMGVLIAALMELENLHEDEVRLINEALDRRNKLIHGFWFERVFKFGKRDSRRELCVEIIEFRNCLQSADSLLQNRTSRIFASLGLTDEMIKSEMDRIRNEFGFG